MIEEIDFCLSKLHFHYGRSYAIDSFVTNMRRILRESVLSSNFKLEEVRVDEYDRRMQDFLIYVSEPYQFVEQGVELDDGRVLILNENIALLDQTVIKSWDNHQHYYITYVTKTLTRGLRSLARLLEPTKEWKFDDCKFGKFCFMGGCSMDQEFGCCNPHHLLDRLVLVVGGFYEGIFESSCELDRFISSMHV